MRRRMGAENVDLLIAASNGLHTLDRADAVVHLSGYRSVGESVLVLPRDGEALLVVSPAADEERVAARYSASPRIAGDDLGRTLKAEFSQRNFLRANIAIAGVDSLPYRLAEKLLALAGPEARAFDNVLYAINGRKTDGELARARQATSIAEKGFARLLELARVGMPECELAVKLNCYTKSLGADDNFLMLSALPHGRAVMPSSGRKLERGDILLAEFTPCFEGQFSQICRTVSIGKPSAELEEKYDLVVRAMWAGIETVRPGIAVAEVCRAIDRVLQQAGYGEYCKAPHMRRRGHGLGCGSVAPGDIATDNETILEEDMFLAVHPNQYIPEVGYLLCGEPVRVTATGVETLSSRTAALGTVDVAASEAGSAPCA